MNPTQYTEFVSKVAKDFGEAGISVRSEHADILHATLGIAGEAGEIVDAVKKTIIYNKPLDRDNLIEETGDVLWYVALMCIGLGVSMEEIMQNNYQKLIKRYPNANYSDANAIARMDKVNG